MQNRSAEAVSRSFNPMSVPGLSNKARDAVNAAFDAMSAWRSEAAEVSEKNGKLVIDKMAAAAAALGWPQQIVEAAQAQIQAISDMQIKTMDQIMDAWEEQLKLPNPMNASPSTILSKLNSLPSFGKTSGWPNMDELQKAAMNPFRFWTQATQQWQKYWTDAMAQWGNRPH